MPDSRRHVTQNSTGGAVMKNIVIKGWMVAVAVFVVMFGGIFVTIGTGHWATSRTAEPVRLESGEFNPADIRGSYAFSEKIFSS